MSTTDVVTDHVSMTDVVTDHVSTTDVVTLTDVSTTNIVTDHVCTTDVVIYLRLMLQIICLWLTLLQIMCL